MQGGKIIWDVPQQLVLHQFHSIYIHNKHMHTQLYANYIYIYTLYYYYTIITLLLLEYYYYYYLLLIIMTYDDL